MDATWAVTDARVDAAAAVLWDKEVLHRQVPWAGAEDDEREPYQRMARLMLEAAARE